MRGSDSRAEACHAEDTVALTEWQRFSRSKAGFYWLTEENREVDSCEGFLVWDIRKS